MISDIARIAAAAESFSGANTSYEYQTAVWLWRFRFHIFHRGDPGEAMHNHPWDFWTLPLQPYVEEFLSDEGTIERQVVPAGKVTFRPAQHTHRVMGLWSGRDTHVAPGKVPTICVRGPYQRDWEYVIVRNGKVHRFPWKAYLKRVDPEVVGRDKPS